MALPPALTAVRFNRIIAAALIHVKPAEKSIGSAHSSADWTQAGTDHLWPITLISGAKEDHNVSIARLSGDPHENPLTRRTSPL